MNSGQGYGVALGDPEGDLWVLRLRALYLEYEGDLGQGYALYWREARVTFRRSYVSRSTCTRMTAYKRFAYTDGYLGGYSNLIEYGDYLPRQLSFEMS